MKFDHPNHQHLYDYWMRKKGPRSAPSRRDMDPLDFHQLLPGIIMYRVHNNPQDYQLSLVGTAISEKWGLNLTGRYLNEIYHGEKLTQIKHQLDEVALNFAPRVDELDARWMNKDYLKYSRLLLPLSSDGKSVDRLIGSLVFKD